MRSAYLLVVAVGCHGASSSPNGSGDDDQQADGGTAGSSDAGVDGAACNVTPEPVKPPSTPIAYVGNQYDFGGTTTSLSGMQPTIDDLANSIITETTNAEAEIKTMRATLKYGRIDADPCAPDQLTTYPGPNGITASDQYRVKVEQGGAPQDSFVYKVLARKHDTNRETDTSWTSFSAKGAVTVHVTKIGGAPTDCIVRPYSAGITTTFAAGTCTFTVAKPGNFSVEFAPEIHNPIAHPMLVFANPPEADVPDPADPNVVYFGPGVHDVGLNQPIESGKTIYLAGGAWVNGAFVASGPVQNVVIRGRGIISGLFYDTGAQETNVPLPGLVDIPDMASQNVLVEGITLVDAPRFNIRALAKDTTIHGVKEMAWWFNTDGIVGGTGSIIEDSFVKVNDDSLKLHWGDTIARRNVLWQLENGGTFNLGWNIEQDVHDFHVYDNDVIHAEHYQYEALAVFRSRQAGAGDLHRYLFEDIRVENAPWRLFYLVLENNQWYDPTLGYGQIDQAIFRNIHDYEAQHQRPNVIQGINGDHKVANVSIQNLFTDGVCVGSAVAGDFSIDATSTNAIRLMRSADGTCVTP
ncbi:MAG: hypothetical protein QM831_28785 [Kofleriaceae bacterium]